MNRKIIALTVVAGGAILLLVLAGVADPGL